MSTKDVRPATGEINQDDLKMAEDLMAEGKPLPADLKLAYDAAHPPKKDDDDNGEGGRKTADGQQDSGTGDNQPPKKDDVTPPANTGQPSEDNADDKGGNNEPPKHRSVQTVPLAKYLDSEKARKEAEDKAKTLEDQLKALPKESDKDYEKEVDDLAVELGMTSEAVKKLDSFFEKRHKLPQEVVSVIQQNKEAQETEAFWQKQNENFSVEFTSEIAEIKKSNPEEVALMEANKEKIKDLAFTDGYNRKSIWELWERYVKPTIDPNRKTLETPGNGSGGASNGTKDWAEVERTPGAITKLSDKEFEEYDKWKSSQSGGTQMRRAKRA